MDFGPKHGRVQGTIQEVFIIPNNDYNIDISEGGEKEIWITGKPLKED